MNINSQRYFLIRESEEFSNRSSRFVWDQSREALILAQNQNLRLPESDSVTALAAWSTASPVILDRFYQQARINGAGNALEYNAGRGFLPLVDGNLQAVDAPVGNFSDIAVGGDGRIAATYSNGTDTHGVLVFHLAKRWQIAAELPEPALRVCVDKDNKIWCFTNTQIICLEGEPLPHTYEPDRDKFEPIRVNPHPLTIVWQIALAGGDNPLALCCDDKNLLVLVHNGAGLQTLLSRSLTLSVGDWQRFSFQEDIPFAIDVQFASPGRWALMVPANAGDTNFIQRDCAIVQLQWDEESSSGETQLVKERYPMLSQAVPRFVSSADGVLRYQAQLELDSEEVAAGFDIDSRELHPLQRPRYYTAASATLLRPLDSGQPETIWHRIYLEGCIPPGSKCTVFAKVYDNPALRSASPFIKQPDWVWCSHRSEQAFGKGLVDSKYNERGLFDSLLQREDGPVRRLQGRYLQLRIMLESDGKRTPVLHALKVIYPRFSYQEAYLPEHMHQEQGVDLSAENQMANGADVRERLLAAFEGVMTPIEEQIANSEILLSAEHTPQQHLPWLGELFGHDIPAHWPDYRRRRWIAETGNLQKCRGTLQGINLALDIISDGAVARGQIVLVENFRLRRTMATVLGLDMDDEEHPLTLGTGMSGNSIVGDSLILSEGDTRDFLALFSPDLATAKEQTVVDDFFESYANQVSVLLHGSAKPLKNLVQSALQDQMPAHVQWTIIETDHPFVLGLAPLLGIDTFLEKRPAPKRVTLDDTYLGSEGLLTNPAALSPQDVNRRGI